MSRPISRIVPILTLSFLATPIATHATVVTLEYGQSFETGGSVYAGDGPFLRATLSDNGPGSTSVHFVLEPFNLASGDYVRSWAFNFSGDASALSLASVAKTGSFDTPNFTAPSSNLGGGNPAFAFSLDFSTSNKQGGAHRFTAGEVLAFDLELNQLTSLNVEDFLTTVAHQNQELISGVFFAGASGSFHYKADRIPVPEISTSAFAAIFVVIIAGVDRLSRRNR